MRKQFYFTAESKVLERSIVFVNNSKICALPITYIRERGNTIDKS
jgi:hypothetical protein